jgi:hypothetical protein
VSVPAARACGKLIRSGGMPIASAISRGSGGRGHDPGRGRGDSAAIGEQFPRVVEQHDTVAEQAPPLLGMAGRNMRGAAVWCLRIRARWLMLTHFILRNGIVILGVARLSLAPAGAGPRWPCPRLWPSSLAVGHPVFMTTVGHSGGRSVVSSPY